jgi:hypothetical protein
LEHEDRITVRLRAHDRLGTDVATRARAVLDDEWLPEPFREPLTQQTCKDVGSATGGNGDNQANRAVG